MELNLQSCSQLRRCCLLQEGQSENFTCKRRSRVRGHRYIVCMVSCFTDKNIRYEVSFLNLENFQKLKIRKTQIKNRRTINILFFYFKQSYPVPIDGPKYFWINASAAVSGKGAK
jgi:hypothetical protein